MKNETEKIYKKSDIFNKWFLNETENMTFQEYYNSSFVIVGIQLNEKNYFLDQDETLLQLLNRNGIRKTENYFYIWQLKKGDKTK